MTENAKKHVLDVYLVKDKSVCNLVCTFVIDSVQLTKKKNAKISQLLQDATKTLHDVRPTTYSNRDVD